MYGNEVNTLAIFLEFATGDSIPLWQSQGTQAYEWLLVQHSLVTYSPARILIEGIFGTGNNGDIAIDDTILEFGLCPSDV